ncbi:MAG TPA: hypothetical protein DEB35_05595, partial [Desulfuromonas sp.]|nr:hypothetical protein [Desulfuromonas sp.]
MKIDRQFFFAYLGLLVLALLSYGNSFPAHFFMDDHSIVELNPLVQHFNLIKILTTDYWGAAANSGLYRPFTILSLFLNRLIFGPSANAFHLVNILLHGAITLLIFPLLQRWKISMSVAWLTAAIFAVHPIHTEVLNMVVGRSELLAAFFLLLALGLAAPLQAYGWQRLGSVAASYLAALLSKEHAIVLLALLPLLDFYVIPDWRRIWPQRRPLYLLLLAGTVLWFLWRTFAVVRTVPRDVVEPAINPLIFMETVPRVLTALQIQGLYLWKLLWPSDLRALYSGTSWFSPPAALTSPVGLVTLVLTLLFLVVLTHGLRHRQLPALGVTCTLISLLPTANIFLLVGVVMAERLAYYPSLWFALALAALLGTIPQRKVFIAFSAVVVLALMGTTLVRNRDFTSEATLWQREVERDPRNVVAWLALAES